MTAERELWKCRRFPAVVRKVLPTLLAGSEMGAASAAPPTGQARASEPRQEHNGANGGWLFFEEAADATQDRGIHGGGDAAGLRVLLAGVVDAKQARRSGRDLCLGAVSEFVERA
jgi:hypothetical protein